jgi:hypothetical protein
MSDREVLNYVKLAALSAGKGQPLGRDRFLILAGAAACHAGLLDVAERCRELVLHDNPRHLIGRFATFPDALRSDEFTPLLKHLQRLCPVEQAEYLLNSNAVPDATASPEGPLAETVRALLQEIHDAGTSARHSDEGMRG